MQIQLYTIASEREREREREKENTRLYKTNLLGGSRRGSVVNESD